MSTVNLNIHSQNEKTDASVGMIDQAKEHILAHKDFYRIASVVLVVLGLVTTAGLAGYSWPKVSNFLTEKNFLTDAIQYIGHNTFLLVREISVWSRPFFASAENLFSVSGGSIFTRGFSYLAALFPSAAALTISSGAVVTALTGFSAIAMVVSGAYAITVLPGIAIGYSGKALWDLTADQK